MLGSVRGALSNERPYRDKVPWFRMPTLLPKRKATRARAPARAPGRSGVVRDPGMHARSWHGNREISRPTTGPRAVWSASGRRGAVADDARTGEVRPRQRRKFGLKPTTRILAASVSNSNETAQNISLKGLRVSSGQHFLLTRSACFLYKCSNSLPYTLYHDLGTGRRNSRRLTKTNRANRVAL